MTDHLIAPHGGTLVDLKVDDSRAEQLRAESRDWPSWDLTDRQLCDIELLINGGFSPLTGFMNRADYDSVVAEMRLTDGTLWPMPITLDVTEEFAGQVAEGDRVALRDPEGVMLAVIEVQDVWAPDKAAEAESVFGTTSTEHPGVAYLVERAGSHYIGGHVEAVQAPLHYDYRRLRQTPAETRAEFARRGWTRDRRLPDQEPDA